MEPRINLIEKGKDAMNAMFALEKYLSKSSLEQSLINLIDYRLSQINGCAYCLDMHSKDLRAEGETEQRIYVLDAWREAPFFSERERTALSWAEADNKCNVPNEVYEDVRNHFSEEEVIELTMAVNAINCWNRINISFKTPAGTYQVGQFAVQAG